MKTKIFLILLLTQISITFSQKTERKYSIRTIAFYNVENLFDTINDVTKNDEASPIMKLKTSKSVVYFDKIDKLASTISKIGTDKATTSPAIIGLSEVENLHVLEDLVKSTHLKKQDYGIIHYDSPDKRGIDVALLYQKRCFTPIYHKAFNPNIYRNNLKVYTRDQLLVTGYLDDELIHIIVNHWPSRSGGVSVTNPLREKAAYQNTKIIAQVREKDPTAKIIIMGDFNDNPTNASFKKVLQTKSRKKNVKENDLYNPYEDLFRRGFNTASYRDKNNLFDQILISSTLLNHDENNFSTYKMYSAKIFNKPFLTNKKGQYKGYPFRSFFNGSYMGGFSDHYPVYLYLLKVKN
ncbi:endonuclease/exonuclease/phosphatase family protein [Polaribacter sp.]|uniref:endonuclease/exonuclease/phosphatase family protein n=1 Tax=Polaribacter sp. TaxID=1920175 RepID=UPI003EF5EC82